MYTLYKPRILRIVISFWLWETVHFKYIFYYNNLIHGTNICAQYQQFSKNDMNHNYVQITEYKTQKNVLILLISH